MISTDVSANVTEKLLTANAARLAQRGVGSARWAAAYLTLSGVAFLVTNHPGLAALHLVLLATLAWSRRSDSAAARLTWSFAPLVIVIALAYGEVPTLISGFAMPFHDDAIQHLELAVFGAQPAHVFATHASNVVLSELLHAGYLSYYLALSIPPVLLYLARREAAFDQTVLTLIVTWLVGCALFVLFPVQGPRFVWSPPSGMPDGPFRRLSAAILAAGSARGTAFPSLHMAASLSQTIMAWRWQSRGIKYAMTASTVLIGIGAVYAGYHYAIDMVAGAVLGSLATAVVISVQGLRNRVVVSG
jgi:membrane-associated phospholipid phosphatase